jgi:hypothetical protein
MPFLKILQTFKYNRKTMSFTFEFALQMWTSKLEGLQTFQKTWHEIVTGAPAAVLPYLLRFSNKYNHVESGLVAITALINIGAVNKDRILEGLQEFNYGGREDFEHLLIDKLVDLQGPHGPYMLDDLARARRTKLGPVWAVLKQRAVRRWSTVLFMIAVKKLWYIFMERICHPDSGYFQRVVVKRFYKNTL